MPAGPIGTAAIGIGTSAANDLVGTALGLALEHHNDKRQINQQTKLQNLQIAGQKEMADYSYGKQLQMWHDTNYSAQMAELEKAGLNPALLYGGGGGGGTTTGTAPATGIGSGDAPKGGQEVQNQIGLQMQGMQLALLNAQKENIEADTKNKETQATKTAGVDTQKTEAETKSITEGITNLQLQQKLTAIQTKAQQQEYDFQGASFADRLDVIKQDARIATGQATTALVQGNVDEETKRTKVDMIKAEYIGQVIENALKEIQGEKYKSDIEVNKQQIKQSVQSIMQAWNHQNVENVEIELKKQMQKYITEPSWNKTWNSLQTSVGDAVKNIIVR